MSIKIGACPVEAPEWQWTCKRTADPESQAEDFERAARYHGRTRKGSAYVFPSSAGGWGWTMVSGDAEPPFGRADDPESARAAVERAHLDALVRESESPPSELAQIAEQLDDVGNSLARIAAELCLVRRFIWAWAKITGYGKPLADALEEIQAIEEVADAGEAASGQVNPTGGREPTPADGESTS